MYCLRRTRERVRSLAMLSESPNTDAAPCLFITRTDRARKLLAQASAVLSWQHGAICKCDTRSVELNIANYTIRAPHPTQERCDQTTAPLDA